jgi:WD40 repeat protein
VKATVGAGTINCVWSPDGNFIALGNRNDVVSIFDLRTGTIMSSYRFLYEVNINILLSLQSFLYIYIQYTQVNELAWTINTDYILATTGGN